MKRYESGDKALFPLDRHIISGGRFVRLAIGTLLLECYRLLAREKPGYRSDKRASQKILTCHRLICILSDCDLSVTKQTNLPLIDNSNSLLHSVLHLELSRIASENYELEDHSSERIAGMSSGDNG